MTGLAALPASADSTLVIRDFSLAHDIQQREPIGATEFFHLDDGRAVAFARIWNGGEPTRISFVWHHDEKTHASVPVKVGVSPAWRTWSTVNLQVGTWRVELVDDQGAVLAQRAFTVEANPEVPVAAPAFPKLGVPNDPGAHPDYSGSAHVPTSAEYPGR